MKGRINKTPTTCRLTILGPNLRPSLLSFLYIDEDGNVNMSENVQLECSLENLNNALRSASLASLLGRFYPPTHSLLAQPLGIRLGLPHWFPKRSGRLVACLPKYCATPRRVVFPSNAFILFGKSRDSILKRFSKPPAPSAQHQRSIH